jgi:predicted Fe-S protein YdhL (DUF1289 family)
MSEADETGGVKSPCVQVCILDETCGYCLGCGRTRAEIWKWTRCSEAEKLEIVTNASARMGAPQRWK